MAMKKIKCEGCLEVNEAITTIGEKYDAVQLELLDLYERHDNGDDVESDIVKAKDTLHIYRSLAKFLYEESH